MSRTVITGKSRPQGRPVAGFVVPGPVVPRQPPSTLGQITKWRSVSIARPGPTTASHQPGSSAGSWRAAWESPLRCDRLPLHFQFNPGSWTFEVKVPATMLGVKSFEAGQTFGFAIDVLDSDRDDCGAETEASWSGARYTHQDPRGLGQLLLH